MVDRTYPLQPGITTTWATGGQKVETVGLDRLGNVVSRTVGGIEDTIERDAAGRIRVERPAGLAPTIHAYDPGSGLLASLTTAGETTAFTYYPDGRPETVTDPSGRTESLVYNVHGLAQRTYGNGAGSLDSTDYTWQALAGQRAHEVTNREGGPGGKSRTIGLGLDGRVISVTEGTEAIFNYSYDGLGRLASIARPIGAKETFAYDGLDRRISRTHGNARWKTTWEDGLAAALEALDGIQERPKRRRQSGTHHSAPGTTVTTIRSPCSVTTSPSCGEAASSRTYLRSRTIHPASTHRRAPLRRRGRGWASSTRETESSSSRNCGNDSANSNSNCTWTKHGLSSSAASNAKRLWRGERGAPETFRFLGLVHICGKSTRGQFLLTRHTDPKRLRTTLQALSAPWSDADMIESMSRVDGSAPSSEGTSRTMRSRRTAGSSAVSEPRSSVRGQEACDGGASDTGSAGSE